LNLATEGPCHNEIVILQLGFDLGNMALANLVSLAVVAEVLLESNVLVGYWHEGGGELVRL
jgi:hypothetical protein